MHRPRESPPPVQAVSITVDASHRVDSLLTAPAQARACFICAHGAGAGMAHPFLQAIAEGLYGSAVATLRFQFPYMQARSRRPDPPALCHTTVRAAVAEAARCLPGLPLIAGGRSFGGRMTSQAQAQEALAGVVGLAFLGFPLHPARRPSDARAQHLSAVTIPMLFLQGDHDELAEAGLLESLIARLGDRATLRLVAGADHAFHVPVRSGRTDREVIAELVGGLCDWIGTVTSSQTSLAAQQPTTGIPDISRRVGSRSSD